MKKIITVALGLALTALSISGCSPNLVNINTETIDPDVVYEVDAWGSNPDIIEFTPIGHKNMTCLLLVSGGDTAAGMSCFPK